MNNNPMNKNKVPRPSRTGLSVQELKQMTALRMAQSQGIGVENYQESTYHQSRPDAIDTTLEYRSNNSFPITPVTPPTKLHTLGGGHSRSPISNPEHSTISHGLTVQELKELTRVRLARESNILPPKPKVSSNLSVSSNGTTGDTRTASVLVDLDRVETSSTASSRYISGGSSPLSIPDTDSIEDNAQSYLHHNYGTNLPRTMPHLHGLNSNANAPYSNNVTSHLSTRNQVQNYSYTNQTVVPNRKVQIPSPQNRYTSNPLSISPTNNSPPLVGRSMSLNQINSIPYLPSSHTTIRQHQQKPQYEPESDFDILQNLDLNGNQSYNGIKSNSSSLYSAPSDQMRGVGFRTNIIPPRQQENVSVDRKSDSYLSSIPAPTYWNPPVNSLLRSAVEQSAKEKELKSSLQFSQPLLVEIPDRYQNTPSNQQESIDVNNTLFPPKRAMTSPAVSGINSGFETVRSSNSNTPLAPLLVDQDSLFNESKVTSNVSPPKPIPPLSPPNSPGGLKSGLGLLRKQANIVCPPFVRQRSLSDVNNLPFEVAESVLLSPTCRSPAITNRTKSLKKERRDSLLSNTSTGSGGEPQRRDSIRSTSSSTSQRAFSPHLIEGTIIDSNNIYYLDSIHPPSNFSNTRPLSPTTYEGNGFPNLSPNEISK